MTSKQSINKNTIFSVIKSAMSIIYPLITFPYISRVLLTNNVGKINFGNSVISYVSLLASLGVTTYAVRECAKCRDDKEKLGKVASEILSINVISTLVAYLALIIVLLFAKPLENYRTLICIQASAVLFATIGADWLNTAMEDFKYITLRTVGVQIISIILMVIFVKKPEDYLIYTIISVVASSGANVLNVIYRRKFCKTRFVIRMNIKKHLPPILLMFSLLLSQIIFTNSDITILGLTRGDYEVGLYGTSVKIYNIINTMVASVAWVVMPQLSALFAKAEYKEINRLLKYSLNFIIILGLPCISGMEIIASEIICTIAGETYIDATISLRILGGALACSFVGGWIANMTMLPAGKEGLCLRSSVVSAVLNVILNIALIPKWGLNAAAFTTVLSELVGVLIILPHIDRNIHIEGLAELFKAPVFGSLGIIAVGVCVKKTMSSCFAITGFTIIISVIWYVFILFVMKDHFFVEFVKPIWNHIGRKV